MGFTIQDYDLRETFRLEKNLLTYVGFYPQENSKTNYLYMCGCVFNLFMSFAQIISMTTQMVIDRNDLSRISESLQYYITLMTFMCKLTNLLIYRKNLLRIEKILTLPNFYGHSDSQLEQFKRNIFGAQTLGNVFRFLCITAIMFYAFPPILDQGKSKILPIPGWFPYNVTTYYYPSFIFQMVGVLNSGYTNSSIDILTWIMISAASGQFEILKDNLKKIDFGDKDVKKTEETFKKCVKHHKATIELVYAIEGMFSGGIFLQFFASVLIICFIGFLMIIVPVKSTQFLFLVMYFLCMMWQVAIYCWYGHDIMAISSTIGDSLYSSNWYETDKKLYNDITIFMEKTKKPVTLTAGKYITLSLTTFTGILRSAYSYFAVLRQMYNNSLI